MRTSVCCGAMSVCLFVGLVAACGSSDSTFPDGSSGASGGASGASGGFGSTSSSGGGASSGGEDDGGGCGATKVDAAPRPINLLVVVDKSGSMSDVPSGFASDKWAAMKTALNASLAASRESLAVGLKLYPDPSISLECGPAGNCCQLGTTTIDVPIGPARTTASQIATALGATSPGGGTPTAAALQAAYDYFDAGAGKALVGERVVLLATDGGPNCNAAATSCAAAACTINVDGYCPSGTPNCCDPASGIGDAQSCLDDANVLARINALRGIGVNTIVVGIPGTEQYASYLDQFAVAGGHPNGAPPPQYFAVRAGGGVAGLTGVLTSITKSLIKSCRLQLQSPPPDPGKLNVFVEGLVVPQGGGDGWELDATTTPPTVVLKGATCGRVESQGVGSAEVRYGCPTVDPR